MAVCVKCRQILSSSFVARISTIRSQFPIEFLCEFLRCTPSHVASMNDEYKRYMDSHEVAASTFDFLGLDEWGEIVIRRVKRATGSADTSESWDRANYLANRWDSIQESIDNSLHLRKRKARERSELDRRKDIEALKRLLRESQYLSNDSQDGLKTVDGKEMPKDAARIEEVGRSLALKFLSEVIRKEKSK